MTPDMEENPGSFLATTDPTRKDLDLDLSTSDHDAAQAVADGLRDAKAANTRRAYASAWHMFSEWTLLTGRRAMPAAPQDVALYLGHLAADGRRQDHRHHLTGPGRNLPRPCRRGDIPDR